MKKFIQMNNFPFFQHHVAKLVFLKKEDITENLADGIADLLIGAFSLKVVSQGKYQFTNNGLTKFWILSQSHLVIHSWPEDSALHVDLMTCGLPVVTAKMITKCFSSLSLKEIFVTRLKY